jgi:hypothetical protein
MTTTNDPIDAPVIPPPSVDNTTPTVEIVVVRNIIQYPVCTSQGTIQPGEIGEATIDEIETAHAYLERV